jgi:hypothetical protein
MLGEVDALDFVIATRLGKSLGEIRQLPNAELVEWAAYLKFERAMQELHGG